ncbi:SRPBCC family protein [Humibacter sp. RRB41]|uniref:SRPBCC family protein n=1 Tax=Humibacter sp. RRB41 TaxID=2919946 RepID=UPI001FAA3EFB|nr:SRPBCC family protein [Humibacter sp. RRB41]
MPSVLTVVTETTRSVIDLFEVSLDIDAHVGSMRQSKERAVDGVRSGQIGLGQTVTWRARHFGVWFTMTSKITELERPARFVDQQVVGPFKSFRHEHVFEEVDGLARMTDTITLASPVFGRVVELLVLVPYLRKLIQQRNQHLLGLLESTPW